MSLSGKIALVTGGGRGIGSAVSQRLAKMGATVLVNYVSQSQAAEETVEVIRKIGGAAELAKFDVASVNEVKEGVNKIVADYGKVDILVNNAGITRDGLVALMKEDDWDQVLTVNLKGAFNCIKAACRSMMKRRWGRIINVTSVIGFAGNAGQTNYAASKAGLVGLTRSTAREFSSRGITVNCVAPGYIDTEMTRDLPDAVKEKILREIPLCVFGEGKDIAGAVAYLASEDGRYITGQVIHVNGGLFMG